MSPFDTVLREIVQQSVVDAYDATETAHHDVECVDEHAAELILQARELLFTARLELGREDHT